MLAKRFARDLEVMHIGPLHFQCDAEGEIRRFTVGGLRSGAATADYIRMQSTSRTSWRGRWAFDGVLKLISCTLLIASVAGHRALPWNAANVCAQFVWVVPSKPCSDLPQTGGSLAHPAPACAV